MNLLAHLMMSLTCTGVDGYECNDRSAANGLSESCARDTLTCQCVTGFSGDACESFYCGDGSLPACSGHGTCTLDDVLDAVRQLETRFVDFQKIGQCNLIVLCICMDL